MKPSSIKVLRVMTSDNTIEIAQSGIKVWLGEKRIAYQTYKELRDVAALNCDEIGDMTYCTINETGKSIARRPELGDEIMNQWFQGKAFQIEQDRIVLMDKP